MHTFSLVNDKFLRRSLIKLGYKLINSAYVTNLPLETILNSLELEVFNLTNQIKTQKVYTNAELLSNVFLFANVLLKSIPLKTPEQL